ncbi:hypothetical protein [Nocardia sp. NPDC005366]|uniref:tetratricopeptide repeat protein n=1 Tax=Nocardia sp. NPDC005366 TaxID=3156878 RepID=UPI0033A5F644
MDKSYSQWHAQNSTHNPPLADLYRTSDPIRWSGSMIYPMYTEQFGPAPIALTVTLLSAAPPAGLRGHGIGLAVMNGFIAFEGRQADSVDVWSAVLHGGATFELTPTGPDALFTLTPVWVDALGIKKSWSGNYGILVEDVPDGRIALWCSIGEGPPNFANLVVGLSTAAAAPHAPPVVEQVARPPEPDELPAPPPRPVVAEPEYGASEANSPRDAPRYETAGPAVEAMQPANDPDRGYRNALYDLAVAMYGRGEEDPACELWEQAAAAGHPTAAYDLGVVRFRRGDLAGAEHWWRSAAQLREPQAMAGLAELVARRGDHAEAEMWRRSAAEERATKSGQSVGSG